MKWYIGQEIVAIVDHSQGPFKKGEVFPIKGLRKAPCGCRKIQIDIGVSNTSPLSCCADCLKVRIEEGSAWWFSEENFAPLDFDISELTSILETPLELAHEQQREEKG